MKHSPEGLEAALEEVFKERTLEESKRPLIIPSDYARRREITTRYRGSSQRLAGFDLIAKLQDLSSLPARIHFAHGTSRNSGTVARPRTDS